MTNEEIRRSNLAILYKESGCRFDNDFCRSIDMMPAQYSQVKFGPKRIGDKMARKIEQGAKKPIGWMPYTVLKFKQADRKLLSKHLHT